MQLRGKRLAAAVPAVIVMTGLAPAPAMAATNHFTTLYETPRHIKAQACQYTYKSAQGYYFRQVRWRADARSATLGGQVQFHNSGGRGAFTSDWVSFKKRSVSKVTTTSFLQDEAATGYLRIQTSKGTSKWSKGRTITSLPHC